MRSHVAGKLARGGTMNSVLEFIRSTQAGPLTRGHLTTRKDLNSIKHQYNIDCVKKGSDDATSVAHWVQGIRHENYNPVLYYKSQGEETNEKGVDKNDFPLAMQMDSRRKFSKYASKLICINTTHGTTAYDFQLMTVLVINDFEEGIPVAWMVSNKESTDSLRVYFQSLIERYGKP